MLSRAVRWAVVVPARCGGTVPDHQYPHPREAPSGAYPHAKENHQMWEQPSVPEYRMTQAMVDDMRQRKPADYPFPDVFPHPHSLEGNFAHIQYQQDARFPDYAINEQRQETSKDPNAHRRDNADIGSKFHQSVYWAGQAMLLFYVGKHAVNAIIDVKGPTRDKYVLGATEIDTNDVPEGSSKTYLWRGKPVFVRHRSAKEIAKEVEVNHTELRDPQPDDQRHTPGNPKWVIMVGVCTHLGCIPIAGAGDFGGYYCPCHGSHYDTAGRIRKGPAPLNLEIPNHEWTDDHTVVIGKV